jgi:hypothetical protein
VPKSQRNEKERKVKTMPTAEETTNTITNHHSHCGKRFEFGVLRRRDDAHFNIGDRQRGRAHPFSVLLLFWISVSQKYSRMGRCNLFPRFISVVQRDFG